MVFLMRVKLRSGRTKVFCFCGRLHASNYHIWTTAKRRLNPNVQSCRFVLV